MTEFVRQTGQRLQKLQTEPPPEYCPGEPLKFPNGVSIVPLGINHDRSFTSYTQLPDAIAKANFLVSELDPSQLPNADTPFFPELLEVARKQKKNVLSVDPDSFDQDGDLLTAATVASAVTLGSLGLAGADVCEEK